MSEFEKFVVENLKAIRQDIAEAVTTAEVTAAELEAYKETTTEHRIDTDHKLDQVIQGFQALERRTTALEYWRTGFAWMGGAIAGTLAYIGIDIVLKFFKWLVSSPAGTGK